MSRIQKFLMAYVLIMAPALIGGCAPKVPPPEGTIEALYEPYVSHKAERGESTWETAQVYSKKFRKTIDRAFDYSLLLNQPVIDYDPVAGAQDFSITNLRIEADYPASAGKAHIVARFENGGRGTIVGYDMLLEDGSWKVDGIRSGKIDLRKSIDLALKAIGNPEEMKAPVEMIYAQYRDAAEVRPLHTWAPLTDDLRDKLADAESRSVILGFDPVCGGRRGVPANVKLEAVSGGVIARFRVDNHQRVAVFDVVQHQGAWTIDDIHSPVKPAWDLVQKLAAAGIR
jgi:Protein of unknown function (DUF3828)